MGLFRALPLLLTLVSPVSVLAADFRDGLIQETWAANELNAAVNQELTELDGRRAATVTAYNILGARLNTYHGWCSTYGITALRKVIEGRIFGKMFSFAAYPFYHVYSNDPYFSGARRGLDEAVDKLRTTKIDLGKCALTEDMVVRMGKDPKQFERGLDEFRGPSFAYAMLAGNLRLIEEEREVLIELKGVISGTGNQNNAAAVEKFVSDSYRRLQSRTGDLRARTLQGFEFSFRVPLGPLEVYNGKNIGHSEGDAIPNFFWIMERRAFYVNQARLAAGELFNVSVANYTKAEVVQERFLTIIREAAGR